MIHTSITTQGRYWQLTSQFDSIQMHLDSFVLHALSLIVAHLGLAWFGIRMPPVSVDLLVGAGAFANAFGWMFCAEACINGIAGPAQALSEL